MLSADPRTRAFLALAAICIIWGTTYTAIKFAVHDFPPFLLVGIRQSIAGMLLMSWAFASGKTHIPNRAYIWKQGLTGIATITGGNGFITWAMQFVPSGLSAVIGSLTPVFVLAINWLWRGPERINAYMIAGVLLGFSGLGIIFSDGWKDFANPAYAWGIAGCFGSCFTWSLGTVMSKRFNSKDVSPIMNAGLQITAGGIGGFTLSALFDKTHQIQHHAASWLAVLYLGVIGSALAFTLYMYVLKHLSATVASLYTYINPVVAILLGWLLLGEHLSWQEGVGMGLTIVGVWLANQGNG